MNKKYVYDILNRLYEIPRGKLGKKKSKEFQDLYNQLLSSLDDCFQEYDKLYSTLKNIDDLLKEDN